MRVRVIEMVAVVSSALAGAGIVALAGPINPSPGAVSATYKTLTEVEPRIAISASNTPGDADSLFRISQPGSYYLTGSITGVVGKHGIEIVSSGVTVDLMGFDLVGIPAMGAFDGVSVTAIQLRSIAVLNGSVRNWGGDGVDLVGALGVYGLRVEGVRASGNAGVGISANNGSTITNCSASTNTSAGIAVGRSSTVTNCSAVFNAGIGFVIGDGSAISNCSASENALSGIVTGSGCTVTNCSARLNAGDGIQIGFACTVAGCSAVDNTGNGIIASTGGLTVHNATITACSATGNDLIGIKTGTGGTITSCSASDNVGNGISAGDGSTVSNCAANSTTGTGISVGAGSTVADCVVRANTVDGILCTFQCTIRGNTCSSNGGAGVHVGGFYTRVEGNNCTLNARGLDVDTQGSIITRNTCSNNSINWELNAGNDIGPIVVAGSNPSAILTSGAVPGSLTTADPHANFSY